MPEQNEMLKIVTPIMEHLYDKLCQFPTEINKHCYENKKYVAP